MSAERLFGSLIGTPYLYSAPATVLRLIDCHGLVRPRKPARVSFAQSAFSIPAHIWTRELSEDEGAMPNVRVFDRRGSYLAAWRSVELPDGEWRHDRPLEGLLPFREIGADAGYYLVDVQPLAAYLAAQRLHDPFVRHPRSDGPTWLTAPLAALAAELADEAGLILDVHERVRAERTVRPLDDIAQKLVDVRHALEASASPFAAEALNLLKDGYTRGTAHLEYGRKPPHPLARPEWRHHIVDRSVANTWRALRRSPRRPFIVGAVDSAVFAVADKFDVPAGLRVDQALGSWQPRAMLPMPRELRPRELFDALMGA